MSTTKIRYYQFFAILLIVLGISISGIYIALLFKDNLLIYEKIELAKFGAIGDFIGGVVGALWALAGVLLFFQALKDQRRDIETNMELLKTQIEQLEANKEIAEEQESILRFQQFETTFFQLFRYFTEITENLEYVEKDAAEVIEKIKGKKVFSKIVEKLYLATENNKTYSIYSDVWALREYEIIYEKMQEVLQPYYGILFQLLKIIDNSNFDIKDQYKCSRILRAYLTHNELIVLNCHWQRMGGAFAELFKKYNLLKDLPISIRPEFLTHKKSLNALNLPDDPRPLDLHLFSETFHHCLLKAFYEKGNRGWDHLHVSFVTIGVKKVNNTLEIMIEIPKAKYISTAVKGFKNPYLETVKKLSSYGFCELIEEWVYAKLVIDNFYKLNLRNVSELYSIEKKVYISKDGNNKVFRCFVVFKDVEKLWVQYDLDELKDAWDKTNQA